MRGSKLDRLATGIEPLKMFCALCEVFSSVFETVDTSCRWSKDPPFQIAVRVNAPIHVTQAGCSVQQLVTSAAVQCKPKLGSFLKCQRQAHSSGVKCLISPTGLLTHKHTKIMSVSAGPLLVLSQCFSPQCCLSRIQILLFQMVKKQTLVHNLPSVTC